MPFRRQIKAQLSDADFIPAASARVNSTNRVRNASSERANDSGTWSAATITKPHARRWLKA
jgi:hypothetical protein